VFNRELEEKVRSARRAFDAATSEDIVASGEQYLTWLEEYLTDLNEQPRLPEPPTASAGTFRLLRGHRGHEGSFAGCD
jgi:hypothetical protein